MAPLARLAASQGWHVSGSDMADNQPTQDLQATGVRISIGHSPANVCCSGHTWQDDHHGLAGDSSAQHAA
ncbi:hypothetical protein WJX72_010137 [[Myrmecia] bisecta]|uniref:Mur ligase N-terminal catalytic domain-containing protein n=1 Tax=[Myrmecia] bisecta TaxID=41462 RepID=A0AAW1R999_9CHLO